MGLALEKQYYHEEPVNVTGAGGPKIRLNSIARTIIAAVCMTLCALYSLALRTQIDVESRTLDDLKVQSQQLDVKISQLQAEVESLKSFEHIEKVLMKNGVELTQPTRAFYIDVDEYQLPVAKSERPRTGRNI